MEKIFTKHNYIDTVDVSESRFYSSWQITQPQDKKTDGKKLRHDKFLAKDFRCV